MRLFVAVELSDEIKKSITSSLHDLKKKGVKGSYIPTQNMHLTLAFIGETGDVGAVKDAIRSLDIKPFRLSLTDFGSFGNLLYVGVKGNQGLSAAAKSVRSALDAAGVSYDKGKFVPHITIIRKFSGSWKQISAPKGEMMVKNISLMKSEVKNGKRVYTLCERSQDSSAS